MSPSGRIVLYGPDCLNGIRRIDNQAYGADYSGDTQLPPERAIVENQYRGLRIGRKVHANQASTAYAYDGAGRVLGIAHRDAQATKLLALYYLYDAVGNLRTRYEYAAGRRNAAELYKYDSKYQLTHYAIGVPPDVFNVGVFAPRQAPPPDSSPLAGQAEIDQLVGDQAQVPNVFTYRYDKLGNRLEERLPDQPQAVLYVPNTLNQYTAKDGTQFSYDLDGNLCREHHGSVADSEYVYDHRHQLSRATANGKDIHFRNDALGRRVWSRIDGIETFYLYDRENVIEERRRLLPHEPVGLFSQYVSESGLDSRCHLAVLGTEYWYHKDLVGSSREMTNVHGVGEASYRYTPFGDLADPLPALPNSYLFAGRRFLPALDVYDFRTRLYQPKIGRFTTRDVLPRGAAAQLYLFARNNPVVRVDPRGEQSADVNKLLELVREAHDNLAKRDFKGFSAAAQRLNGEIEASRARGRAAAKGMGEGVVNMVLGLLNTAGSAFSYQPIATEYHVNFTRPGRIWQRTDRLRDWEYAKEQALNRTLLYPVGRMLGELPASAIVASSSEYSQAARIESSANTGRLLPGFLLTVATARPALQTAKTIGIRVEAAKAAARSPRKTPNALYRTYSEKVIALTPGHPLKGLLDPSTGRFMRPPSRRHSDLADGPYVQIMHVVSNKAGGTKVAIGDAYINQVDNVVLEHPSRGGYVANEVVTIGGIQIEKRSAQFLERFGIIPRGSVEGATKASGWTPWW